MAKCKRCGKKGLFLKLDSDGLCSDCSTIAAEKNILAEAHKNKIENRLPELQPLPRTSVIKYNDCDINKQIHEDAKNKQLSCARKYEYDYVQVVSACCCSECAKYRFRIYCISGNDTRFPILPDYVKKYSWHCGLSVYPFSLGVNYMRLSENKSLNEIDELIEYSNRPFVDDRADEEIERYNRILAKNKQDYIDGLNKEQARLEYEKIAVLLPDIAPKSQGAYTRMKKSNSANFQKLKENAVSVGIEIKDIDNNGG